MDRPTHPWLIWLRAKFGVEHVDFHQVADWLYRSTGHEATPDSLRLIAQGHRPPGSSLAFDIETACLADRQVKSIKARTGIVISARELVGWEHYSRPVGSRAA